MSLFWVIRHAPEVLISSTRNVLTRWKTFTCQNCFTVINRHKIFLAIQTRQQASDTKHNDRPLTSISCGTAIASFLKNGRPREAEMALQELLNEYAKSKHPDMIPERIQFNTLIDAWAKSGEKGSAQRAEALLETMSNVARQANNQNLLPDVYSFTSVLNAWAKSNDPEASTHAEAILHQMHELGKIGTTDLKPTNVSYNTFLDCLANARSIIAAEKAEVFLVRMIAQYNAGNEMIKPDIISFNIVINAFAKSGVLNSAPKAEAVFDRMKALGVQPDTTTFNSLISAWTNSRDPRAADKAAKYLKDMTRLYEGGHESCKPDTTSFNAVVNAWSRSKDSMAADRAQELLEEMKQWETKGHTDCRPDVITYTSLLNVVARSKAKDKAVVSWNILGEMEKRFIKPDERVFGSVMMACAFSKTFDRPTRQLAFDIALKTFRRAYFETKPSAETFSFFFQAAEGLGHDKEVELVYRFCCKAGFENNALVQRDVKNAAPYLVRKHFADKSSAYR